MADFAQESLDIHKKYGGKIHLGLSVPLETADDLSRAYTPGVAAPCLAIAEDEEKAKTLTWRKNLVAVITDGSAVLGLGNIGAAAGMPVMEGKCALFKKFAGVDAVPICLKTQDEEEIISIVQNLEPSFGGINLEDIAAPRCFAIEKKLKETLGIPVFHDDQHGTAIVTLAALKNALQIVEKNISKVKIVMSGAGAAGISIARLLLADGAKNIILCDSRGAIASDRSDLHISKEEMRKKTNPTDERGSLEKVLRGADVFIGVSAPGLLRAKNIETMNSDAIVFAMANPTPEILPEEAKKGGARIVATGRSDFPNQVNNVLVFPGLFQGIFSSSAPQFTEEMFLAAANALAGLVKNPHEEEILPSVFQKGVAEVIAEAVKGV